MDGVVKHGHPARAIVNLAQEEGHDCIVIPSRQPTGTTSGWARPPRASCATRNSVHVLREQGATDA